MCGRYALNAPRDKIWQQFKIERAAETLERLLERFNVAPSQQVAAVRLAADAKRELVALRWGLIPAWSKEPKTEYSTINARAETVAEKPTFRNAFRRRHCLVLADGFYEWKGGRVRLQAALVHHPHIRRTLCLRWPLGALGAETGHRGRSG